MVHYCYCYSYTAATAPQNFTVEGASETTITVLWRVPEMPNGVIAQYNVSLSSGFESMSSIHVTHYMQLTAVGTKSYDENFSETKNFTVPEDMTMTDLTGLTPGTMYVITIYAVNGAGRGETATVNRMTLNGTVYNYFTLSFLNLSLCITFSLCLASLRVTLA